MKKSLKQILAILAIILLAALYLTTLIVSFLDFPGKMHFFTACIVATLALPIIIWLLIWSAGKLKKKED